AGTPGALLPIPGEQFVAAGLEPLGVSRRERLPLGEEPIGRDGRDAAGRVDPATREQVRERGQVGSGARVRLERGDPRRGVGRGAGTEEVTTVRAETGAGPPTPAPRRLEGNRDRLTRRRIPDVRLLESAERRDESVIRAEGHRRRPRGLLEQREGQRAG